MVRGEMTISLAQINHIQHQLECIKVMLEIFQMTHRKSYQTFHVGYINKNWSCGHKTVKVNKAKVVLAEDKAWRSHHKKEWNKICLRLSIWHRDCILGFWGKVVLLKTWYIRARIKLLLKNSCHNSIAYWS